MIRVRCKTLESAPPPTRNVCFFCRAQRVAPMHFLSRRVQNVCRPLVFHKHLSDIDRVYFTRMAVPNARDSSVCTHLSVFTHRQVCFFRPFFLFFRRTKTFFFHFRQTADNFFRRPNRFVFNRVEIRHNTVTTFT